MMAVCVSNMITTKNNIIFTFINQSINNQSLQQQNHKSKQQELLEVCRKRSNWIFHSNCPGRILSRKWKLVVDDWTAESGWLRTAKSSWFAVLCCQQRCNLRSNLRRRKRRIAALVLMMMKMLIVVICSGKMRATFPCEFVDCQSCTGDHSIVGKFDWTNQQELDLWSVDIEWPMQLWDHLYHV